MYDSYVLETLKPIERRLHHSEPIDRGNNNVIGIRRKDHPRFSCNVHRAEVSCARWSLWQELIEIAGDTNNLPYLTNLSGICVV